MEAIAFSNNEGKFEVSNQEIKKILAKRVNANSWIGQGDLMMIFGTTALNTTLP